MLNHWHINSLVDHQGVTISSQWMVVHYIHFNGSENLRPIIGVIYGYTGIYIILMYNKEVLANYTFVWMWVLLKSRIIIMRRNDYTNKNNYQERKWYCQSQFDWAAQVTLSIIIPYFYSSSDGLYQDGYYHLTWSIQWNH